MKKFMLFLLMLCGKTYAAGSMIQDFNGSQGYYEINVGEMDVLKDIIQDLDTPAAKLCKQVMEKSRRIIKTVGCDLFYIYNDIKEENGLERCVKEFREAIEFQESVTAGKTTFEEKIEIGAYCLEVGKEKFSTLAHEQLAQLKSERLPIENNYYENIHPFFGDVRLSTWRNFINKAMLGLTGFPPIAGSEELFQIMKKTGFLNTRIASIQGYTYSQKISAREFLEAHPEIQSLILGCGSFIHRGITDNLFGQQEGGCGMCTDCHHSFKGEMTMSLPDNADFSIDFEEGAASDIVGNFLSPVFWEGFREGLHERKLDFIKDHTHYRISLTPECLKQIKFCLSDMGIFEIHGPGAFSPADYQMLETHGFILSKEPMIKNRWPVHQFKKK